MCCTFLINRNYLLKVVENNQMIYNQINEEFAYKYIIKNINIKAN